MNQEIKKLWIEDLRANGDKQGKQWLQQDGKFCCLGRLCELAVREGVIKSPGISKFDISFYDDNLTNLSLKVQEWSGITDSEALLNQPIGIHRCLIELNDKANYTFAQIADVIEEQF